MFHFGRQPQEEVQNCPDRYVGYVLRPHTHTHEDGHEDGHVDGTASFLLRMPCAVNRVHSLELVMQLPFCNPQHFYSDENELPFWGWR